MRPLVSIALVVLIGCGSGGEADPFDLDFEIPRTETFAAQLSAYALYQEPLSALEPSPGTYLYELSSELFTDYAHKQRLLRVPAGQAISRVNAETLVYPEGTILAKTFLYPDDLREPGGPARVIETRLLVKRAGAWNMATYLWNVEQTEATLLLDGTTTEVQWLSSSGQPTSTEYVVPHEGECVTCHQASGATAFIGPSVRSLNREVERDGTTSNQLVFLEAQGVLEPSSSDASPTLPNYKDDLPLEPRARAYLDINCAHCHNPSGWDEASDRNLDFRYATPLSQTGLVRNKTDVIRQLETNQMPFLGTTLPHKEGVRLVLDYLSTL